MKIDLDRIEAVARAATVWPDCDIVSGEPVAGTVEMEWQDVIDCDLLDDCQPMTRAFLEDCSPAVVLALVQRVRELEADDARLRSWNRAARQDLFEHYNSFVCEKCHSAKDMDDAGFTLDISPPLTYCKECRP